MPAAADIRLIASGEVLRMVAAAGIEHARRGMSSCRFEDAHGALAKWR